MSIDIEFDAWQRNHFASIMAHMRAAGNNDPVLSGMIQSAIKGAWQAARATPQAPTPAAAEGQAEARQEVTYLLRNCLPSLARCGQKSLIHEVNTFLNAAPLPRQAAVQGEFSAHPDRIIQQANEVRDAQRWNHFVNEAEFDIYRMKNGIYRTTATLFWDSPEREFADGKALARAVDAILAKPATPQTAPDQAKSAPATTEKDA